MVLLTRFINSVSELTGATHEYLIKKWEEANKEVEQEIAMIEKSKLERTEKKKRRKKEKTEEEKRHYRHKMEKYRDECSYTLAELKDLCKLAGLKTGGIKSVLKHRLKTGEGKAVKAKGDIGGYTFSSLSAKIMEEKNRSLISRIKDGCVKFKVSKNKYGNYENTESGIIINSTTNIAIGVQNDDGTVRSLLPDDINICRKFNISYEVAEELHDTIEKVRFDPNDAVEVLTKEDYAYIDSLEGYR